MPNHTDARGFQYNHGCIDVQLHSRVFTDEVSEHLEYLNEERDKDQGSVLVPDILVVGVALWDALHYKNATRYRERLEVLTNQLKQMLDQVCHVKCSDSRLWQTHFHTGIVKCSSIQQPSYIRVGTQLGCLSLLVCALPLDAAS